MRRLFFFALLLLAPLVASAQEPECFHSQPVDAPGEKLTREVTGYTVEIRHEPDEPGSDYFLCRARVIAPSGAVVLEEEDFGLKLLAISGRDLNGDSTPELVLETFSGGAHCCWTYVILSLGPRPRVLLRLENQHAFAFDDLDGDGHIDICTYDGAFGYFDELSYADSPVPALYLRLAGDTLVDQGPSFQARYDEQIRKARVELTEERRRALREAQSPYQDPNARAAAPYALAIVLAYLYSGREEEAWEALDELWPAHDALRLRGLILQTRESGLLHCLGARQCIEPDEP